MPPTIGAVSSARSAASGAQRTRTIGEMAQSAQAMDAPAVQAQSVRASRVSKPDSISKAPESASPDIGVDEVEKIDGLKQSGPGDEYLWTMGMLGKTIDDLAKENNMSREDVRQAQLRHIKANRNNPKFSVAQEDLVSRRQYEEEMARFGIYPPGNPEYYGDPSDEANIDLARRKAADVGLTIDEASTTPDYAMYQRIMGPRVPDRNELLETYIYNRRMRGERLEEVADAMGMSRTDVRRAEMRHSDRIRKRTQLNSGGTRDQIRDAEIYRLRTERGMSLDAVAEQYGVDRSAIRQSEMRHIQRMRDAGIKVDETDLQKNDRRIYEKRVADKLTLEEMSDLTGMTRAEIRQAESRHSKRLRDELNAVNALQSSGTGERGRKYGTPERTGPLEDNEIAELEKARTASARTLTSEEMGFGLSQDFTFYDLRSGDNEINATITPSELTSYEDPDKFVGRTTVFGDGKRGVIIAAKAPVPMRERSGEEREFTAESGAVQVLVTHDQDGNIIKEPRIITAEMYQELARGDNGVFPMEELSWLSDDYPGIYDDSIAIENYRLDDDVAIQLTEYAKFRNAGDRTSYSFGKMKERKRNSGPRFASRGDDKKKPDAERKIRARTRAQAEVSALGVPRNRQRRRDGDRLGTSSVYASQSLRPRASGDGAGTDVYPQGTGFAGVITRGSTISPSPLLKRRLAEYRRRTGNRKVNVPVEIRKGDNPNEGFVDGDSWYLPAAKVRDIFRLQPTGDNPDGRVLKDKELSQLLGIPLSEIAEWDKDGAVIESSTAQELIDMVYPPGIANSGLVQAKIWGFESAPYWVDEGDIDPLTMNPTRIDRDAFNKIVGLPENKRRSQGISQGRIQPRMTLGEVGEGEGLTVAEANARQAANRALDEVRTGGLERFAPANDARMQVAEIAVNRFPLNETLRAMGLIEESQQFSDLTREQQDALAKAMRSQFGIKVDTPTIRENWTSSGVPMDTVLLLRARKAFGDSPMSEIYGPEFGQLDDLPSKQDAALKVVTKLEELGLSDSEIKKFLSGVNGMPKGLNGTQLKEKIKNFDAGNKPGSMVLTDPGRGKESLHRTATTKQLQDLLDAYNAIAEEKGSTVLSADELFDLGSTRTERPSPKITTESISDTAEEIDDAASEAVNAADSAEEAARKAEEELIVDDSGKVVANIKDIEKQKAQRIKLAKEMEEAEDVYGSAAQHLSDDEISELTDPRLESEIKESRAAQFKLSKIRRELDLKWRKASSINNDDDRKKAQAKILTEEASNEEILKLSPVAASLDSLLAEKKRRSSSSDKPTLSSSGKRTVGTNRSGAKRQASTPRKASGSFTKKLGSGLNERVELRSGDTRVKDYYKVLTDKIIEKINEAESSGGKYDFPWHKVDNFPRNGITGKHYQGGNILALAFAAEERGFDTPVWATEKQWAQQGGKLKDGELDNPVWLLMPKVFVAIEKDKETGEEKKKSVVTWRAYRVWNVDQVDGVDKAQFKPEYEKLSETERAQNLEIAVKEVGAKIIDSTASRAAFDPYRDVVEMPQFGDFKSSLQYYAVLLHELVHWTGHDSRLNRPQRNYFGTPEYAREELVAEMGSAFLMSLFGLSSEVRDDHAQYLAGWKTLLKKEPDILQKTAVAAQEAADFLIDKMPSMKETVAAVTNAGNKATDAVRGGGRITSEAAEKAKGELTDELRSEIKSWLSSYSGDNKFLKSIKSQLKRISSGRSGGKTDLSDAQWAAILKAYREATKK